MANSKAFRSFYKEVGGNKTKSAKSIAKSQRKNHSDTVVGCGYGGHFRAVQGFKYIGER